MQLPSLPTNCETERFERKMLTSKRSFFVLFCNMSTIKFKCTLHATSFLHCSTRALKPLCPPPFLLHCISLPCVSTVKKQRPHQKTYSLIRSFLCRREWCFCLVRDTRPLSSQKIVSIKKNKEHMANRVPCKNSLIGNHFIAHSEKAGAIVRSPKPPKAPCFHFTVNNDLW